MKKLANNWKSLTKGRKVQIAAASLLTLLLTVQLPTGAWFRNQREAARMERIDAPNTLYITAAHREDAINLVMDDITVDGKWSSGDDMQYQDYVFCVAGEYVESFTLQLTHTTNNPYYYEIFEADPTGGSPGEGEIEGRDYVIYNVTNNYYDELAGIADTSGTQITDGIIYYRIKKTANNKVSLNQTSDLQAGETNLCSFQIGSSSTYNYNGKYLNLVEPPTTTATTTTVTTTAETTTTTTATTKYMLANTTYVTKSYSGYSYYDEHSVPLYWQCTNIPGSDGTSKNAFYREYILRVYFNGASPTYKDTDIIYITASGD
ncbi:MAG: hypothetical protein IKO47_02850 [Ruminococcus sp.]|nr:hypothetical protein [Ruminococcus sp.]